MASVIVVDLGCMTYDAHREDESMMTLIDRFRPEVYYGFDPHPGQEEYDGFAGTWAPQSATFVRREAAWTFDGEIGLTVPPLVLNPLRTTTMLDAWNGIAKCFDLALFLRRTGPVVLKMDVEGAEHVLLPHIFNDAEAASMVELLLIEWHGEPSFEIPCPWEEWG